MTPVEAYRYAAASLRANHGQQADGASPAYRQGWHAAADFLQYLALPLTPDELAGIPDPEWQRITDYIDRRIVEMFARGPREYMALTLAESEVNRLRREQAERHCEPTQDAYDAACAALHKHRDRADILADLVDVVSEQAGRAAVGTQDEGARGVLFTIAERLRAAHDRDQITRREPPNPAHPRTWPLAVGCPACGAPERTWCLDSESGGSNIGHVHSVRRDAADAAPMPVGGFPRGGWPLPPPALPTHLSGLVEGVCLRCGGLDGMHVFRECEQS